MAYSFSSYPQLKARRCLAKAGAALALSALSALPMLAQPERAQAQTGLSFNTLDSFPGLSQGATTDPANFYTATLVLGADGNYYGTRPIGGAHNDGFVFKLTPSGTLTTLYSFAGGSDGAYPYGKLVQASDGTLYGVTATTVFKIATAASNPTILHTFSSTTDGTLPAGGLTLGSDGNYYGTTSSGGANGTGTMFQITPAGVLTVIYSFTALQGASGTSVDGYSNTDGAYPDSPLTLGQDGNLYGTTFRGGDNDYGTIYEVSTTGSQGTVWSFDAGPVGAQSDGDNSGSTVIPVGPLAQSASGTFYGTAEVGGNGTGSVYEFSAGSAPTAVHDFSATASGSASDGADPVSGVVIGQDGALYGSTEFGGTNGDGTLYRLTPGGSLFTLHTFAAAASGSNSTNSDGDYPTAPLVAYTDGSFYGATSLGGAHGTGTVFHLVPGTYVQPTESRFDFNGDGHADLIWYNTGSGAVSVWDMNDQSVLQFGATFAQLAPSTGWQPVAAPDVNNDGTPDLIWWNNQTGELSAWTLTAGALPSVSNFGADFGQISDTDWKPVAAGDVTGTTWELVFQNTSTGDISRWLMNGTTVTQYGGTLGSLGAGSPWQIVGAPDLDGDGKSDLLFWNSQTGEVSYWSTDLAAGSVLAYHSDFAQVQDTSWHLVGSEDTNGDGQSDLIWWNATSGAESRWLLNGTNVTQYGNTDAQVQDTTWQPTAIR